MDKDFWFLLGYIFGFIMSLGTYILLNRDRDD